MEAPSAGKPESRLQSAATTGLTVSAPDVRPMSADIPIMDMYRYSKLPNTDYGLEGYDTPVQHFDHALKKKNDELWKLNSQGKRKKGPPIDMKAKRGGLTDVIEARAKATPGPWVYDIKTEWIHGPKTKVLEEVPPKEVQGLQFKWQGVPKDKREFRSRPKTARAKLDLSVDTLLMAGQKVFLHRLGHSAKYQERLSATRSRLPLP